MPANNEIKVANLDVREAEFTFFLPKGIGDGDTFMTIDPAGKAQVEDSTLLLGGHLEDLGKSDEIVLIDGKIEGVPVNLGYNEAAIGNTVLLDYDLDIGAGGNDLLASIIGHKTNPQAKALSEGQAAASAFVNQAGDLLADAGVNNARRVSSTSAGPAVFTALSYSDMRYDTGSHVDVQGFSILVGAAYGLDAGVGRFTIGGFLEYGTGDYDTFNDFARYPSVNGEGDTDYLELSARVGRVSADFASVILGPVSYDASSTYYGIHAGAGHIFNLSDSADLDLYGKFFWTHQQGKTVPDPVTFSDIDSSRVRAGARLTHRFTDTIGVYAGAAYEHEFGGKATAFSRGFALETPALRGNTGMGELGLTAIANENVSLDFGLQGYGGDRRGVGGSVKLNVKF